MLLSSSSSTFSTGIENSLISVNSLLRTVVFAVEELAVLSHDLVETDPVTIVVVAFVAFVAVVAFVAIVEFVVVVAQFVVVELVVVVALFAVVAFVDAVFVVVDKFVVFVVEGVVVVVEGFVFALLVLKIFIFKQQFITFFM